MFRVVLVSSKYIHLSSMLKKQGEVLNKEIIFVSLIRAIFKNHIS